MRSVELTALYARMNRLVHNGKNSESQGVLRKIVRAIRKHGGEVDFIFN